MDIFSCIQYVQPFISFIPVAEVFMPHLLPLLVGPVQSLTLVDTLYAFPNLLHTTYILTLLSAPLPFIILVHCLGIYER